MSASPRITRLLAVLDEQPGSTLAELSEETGLPPRQLAMLLWRLEDERLVAHEAHRWFRAPSRHP